MKNNLSKGMQLEKKYQKLFESDKSFDSRKSTMSQLIIKQAIEKDIPIHRDKELLTKLAKLELERDTPEVYYPAVAEIITYLNKLDHQYHRANA